MTIDNRCLPIFLLVLFVLGASVLHAGANTNFRMSEIQKNKNQNTGTARGDILANRLGDRKTVVLRGTIDGDGTFVFQGDKIVYRNGSYNYPTNVTVSGKTWRNLDEPFELGFTPVFNSAELLEKEGRNADTIRLTKYEDHAELYLYDSAGSSAPYRISVAFDDESANRWKKDEEQKKTETRRKVEERKKAADDDGDEFFVSLPSKEKKNKNEKTVADAKKKYVDNEKLQGVLYPLVLRSKGRNSLISINKDGDADAGGDVIPILQKFVLGSWQQLSDAAGNRHYPELDQFFDRLPTPGFSFFYQDMIDWQDGAALFRAGNKAGTPVDFNAESGWLAIYSGYVIAPFTGKFRFLGYCDDTMLVRFNRQIVIDYGCLSLTTGMQLDSSSSGGTFLSVLGGNPLSPEEKRKIAGSPLYSKYRLKVRYPDFDRNHGLAESPVLNMTKGQVIPIDILLAEQATLRFCMILLVERLDSNGGRIDDPRAVSLFRTTPELPVIQEGSSLPEFYSDGPIWKVVDANGKPISPKTTP